MPVIDDWLAVRAVPAVEFDAAAAVRVRADVRVDRRRRFELRSVSDAVQRTMRNK